MKNHFHKRTRSLGKIELIAIALGGMVGGGIFSILGISVSIIGNSTPIALLIGGVLAFFAAYSYVKLSGLYKDEGATYSFFSKTFPNSKFASSSIGWLIVFGYISTLALYAFTFSTYLCSVLPFQNSTFLNKTIACLIISVFALINVVSVKGMGKIEDFMVYLKLILLIFISYILTNNGSIENITPLFESHTSFTNILIVSSITFVAYEGFQLVIHAYNEMENPGKNIPIAIYSSIGIATFLYIILSVGALSAIPKELLIADQEYALAAGAEKILGKVGLFIVIFGALLATSSAINGTIFGASRLMAVISKDGYFPSILSKKVKTHIPKNAIICMSICAFILIISGGLKIILEFGSITFIMVSFLMALSNFIKRKETFTHIIPAIVAMIGLFIAGTMIFYYEWNENKTQLIYIVSIYIILIIIASIYARKKSNVN